MNAVVVSCDTPAFGLHLRDLVPGRDFQRYFGMAALADADTHDIESPADIRSLVKDALGD